MINLKLQLQQAIAQAVKKITGLNIKSDEVFLEHPENEAFGDYSSNIAMTMFRNVKCQMSKLTELNNPRQLAEKIKSQLLRRPADTHYPLPVDSIRIDGPGFINLSINNDYLINQMEQVLKDKECYGTRPPNNKKIMVEYAHPNTHKAFHIGHLRNISTGETIARILAANGYKIIRANYQGDVGIHIAKCLWGIITGSKFIRQPADQSSKFDINKFNRISNTWDLEQKAKFMGEAYVLGSDAYEKDEKAQPEIQDINYLIYAAAQKYQQQVHHLQPGSTDYMKFVTGKKYKLEIIYDLWVETRQWSLDYFDNIYQRLDSHFDHFYFESQCLKGVDKCYEALKKGVLSIGEKGAIIFNGKPYGLDTRVFINSLGLPTYEGKELGLAPMELSEFGHLNKLIHVVTPEQTSFFKITFKVEELLGIQKDQQYHLAYNWVNLKGGKMSSRIGNVVLGEWILDEAKAKIKKEFPKVDEETAEMIAVGAVKYSFLKPGVSSAIAFDFDESVSLDGNSGPYLQYTYARAQSVLRKCQMSSANRRIKGQNHMLNVKTDQLNAEELTILRWLYRFPEVVEQAGENLSPNIICNFLYDLAQRYNTFYNKHRILDDGRQMTEDRIGEEKAESRKEFRLMLTAATAQLLKNGLTLLGIKTPRKM